MSDADKDPYVSKADKLKLEYQKKVKAYEKGQAEDETEDNSEMDEESDKSKFEVNSRSEEVIVADDYFTGSKDHTWIGHPIFELSQHVFRFSKELLALITSILLCNSHERYVDMIANPEAANVFRLRAKGTEIDLQRPWRRETMHNLVKEATGIDFIAFGNDVDAAKEATKAILGKGEESKDNLLIQACTSVGYVLNEDKLSRDGTKACIKTIKKKLG